MVSIPILAAVATSVVVPVVGTGAYYLANNSKSETSTQEETPKAKEHSVSTGPSKSDIHDGLLNYNSGIGSDIDVKALINNVRDRTDFLQGRIPGSELNIRQDFEERVKEIRAEASAFTGGLLHGHMDQFQQTKLGHFTPSSIKYSETVTRGQKLDVSRNGKGFTSDWSISATRTHDYPEWQITSSTSNITRKGE